MDEFSLEGQEWVELKNLLKLVGLCETGGEAKIVISEGLVKVDGAVELRKRCKIRSDQVVEYEGHKVTVR
ncbi:MAG: RNA-binding S4 domain-containing protein [Deltaproteobacteria bacterium]|jgi:ribosome-associated protein|nr:RNA-binding S4 domain-containing protein [Deltaproteobacteria bacterium]